MSGASDWSDYLDRFHHGRAGITEDVLARSRDDQGDDPYRWMTRAVPAAATVVDVACGSAPTAPVGPSSSPPEPAGPRWVGVDTSPHELRAARAAGRGPLVLASAGALPVASGHTDVVTAAMALMVVDDPVRVLAEVRRVLGDRSGPGDRAMRSDHGRLVLLVPAEGPLGVGDRARWAATLAALGCRRLPFPNPEVVDDPVGVLGAAGFAVRNDEARSFAYPLADRSDAARLVASLYLPGVANHRQAQARWVLSRLPGATIGLPLRRIVAEPDDGGRSR